MALMLVQIGTQSYCGTVQSFVLGSVTDFINILDPYYNQTMFTPTQTYSQYITTKISSYGSPSILYTEFSYLATGFCVQNISSQNLTIWLSLYLTFAYCTNPNQNSAGACNDNSTNSVTLTYPQTLVQSIEFITVQYFAYNRQPNSEMTYTNYLSQVLTPIYPGIPYFALNYIKSTTICYLTQVFDPSTGLCHDCGSLFPNCAACTLNSCTICLLLHFWNPNYFNQTLNAIAGTCLLDGCPLGNGPVYGPTTIGVGYNGLPLQQSIGYCKVCDVQNCDICNYTQTGYVFNKTSLKFDYLTGPGQCKRCAKGYLLNATTKATCDYIQNKTLTLDLLVVSTYVGVGTIAQGYASNYTYFYIAQALGVITQLYKNGTYYKINVTIHLTSGNHFFYYRDYSYNVGSPSGPSAWWTDQYMQTPMDTDNVYIKIKPFECSEQASLNYFYVSSNPTQALCVNISQNQLPTVIVLSQYAYFNISGYTVIENIIFSGLNQDFIYTEETALDPLIYVGVNYNSSDRENGFYFNFSSAGFVSYNSILSNDIDTSRKCRANSFFKTYQATESLQQCQGEPNHPSFFTSFNISSFTQTINYGLLTSYTLYSQDITRIFALFNLYSFDSYRSTRNRLPELRITNCTFSYFLNNYTALITVQNNNFRVRTSTFVYIPFPSSTTTTFYNYTDYHYYGSDNGVRIIIKGSTFANSTFCKGLISYQRKINLTNSYLINDYSNYYQPNKKPNDSSVIIVYNSTFQNLNAYTNITALQLISDGTSTSYYFPGSTRDTLLFKQTNHRSSILNLNGFVGSVEVNGCTIKGNKYIIPEIVNGERSQTTTADKSQFQDSKFNEVKMAICSQDIFESKYFFADGFDDTDDLDQFYDQYQRVTPIYISGNQGNIIFRNNNFSQNIGTFGGAVNINSQNWQTTNQSYIVFINNTFSNNMAYFAGNAVYIRNTRLSTNASLQCGGTYFYNNTFSQNIGLKRHNGGAIAGYCFQIGSTLHDDAYQTSTHYFDNSLETNHNITSSFDSAIITVPIYQFTIQSTTFRENMSGFKGSAVYLRYMSQIQIINCSFIGNGPVFSQNEILYSPYYYFLNRTVSYYNSNPQCSDELQFMVNCQGIENRIDWPYIQGALYIEHCQSQSCFGFSNSSSNYMQSLVTDSIFFNNMASPIMDEYFPTDLASSIFISGGLNNTIIRTSFQSNQNNIFTTIPNELLEFFPQDYFNYAQQAQIYISVNPVITKSSQFAFSTQIIQSQFNGMRNMQTLGLSNYNSQQVSQISYITNYQDELDTYIPSLSLISSSFTNNTSIGEGSSLIYIENGILIVNGSSFNGNGYLSANSLSSQGQSNFYQQYSLSLSQSYGIFNVYNTETFANQSTHLITNNIFNCSSASKGSVFYLNIEGQNIIMNDNIFNYNIALTGSVIYAVCYQRANSIVLNEGIINQNLNEDFGAIYITNNDFGTTTLSINNFTFSNCFSSMGSSLYLYSIAQLALTNSIFYQDNTVSQFNDLFAKLSFISLFVDHNLISTIVDDLIGFQNGGQIYLENVQNYQNLNQITTQNQMIYVQKFSQFINVSFSDLQAIEGTILYMLGSLVQFQNDLNSIISGNSLINNGLFYLDQQSFLIAYGLQILNTRSQVSSSLFCLQKSTFTCDTCSFINNTSQMYGLIYVGTNSYFTCTFCRIILNQAYDSTLLYGIENPTSLVVFNNTLFQNNTSFQNMLTLSQTNVLFQSCTFIDNTAEFLNNGITQSSSTLIIQNSTISLTNKEELNSNIYYGFILSASKSQVIISSSFFMNIRGSYASILQSSGSSNITVSNSTFINCESSSGATFQVQNSPESIFIGSNFVNNSDNDIYAEASNVQVISVNFQSTLEQSIYLIDSNASITQSTFTNGSNFNINGKAIYCDCLQISISNCTFMNLNSLQGGAIYLTDASLQSQFVIAQSNFFNNSAQLGGAIYINDALQLIIDHNTFANNKAYYNSSHSELSLVNKGQGGALYLSCTNSDLGISSNCRIKLLNNNSFISNHASDDGGAIQYISTKYIDDNSQTFINNSAFYGQDVASYPDSINAVLIENRDYSNLFKSNYTVDINQRQQSQSQSFPPIVSGTPFYILLEIIDQEGYIYSTDSLSSATLFPKAQDGTLLQNFQATASNGIYNFSELVILAQPSTNVTLSLQVSGVETYSNNVTFIKQTLSYNFHLRACVSGEELSSNKSCTKCLPGSYLLGVQNSVSSCLSCPTGAVCFGGDQMYPNTSYWRINSTTHEIIKCQNTDACVGGNDTLDRDNLCAQGYEGIICGTCTSNYFTESTFTCRECPSKAKNIIKLVALGILGVLIVVYLVYSTITNSQEEKPAYSAYLKIMVNHYQVLAAIANIKYQWPQKIEQFYNDQVTVSQLPIQVFSFDCFLMDNNLVINGYSVYFQKLIIYGLLPLGIIMITCILWSFITMVRRNTQMISDKIISSITILLFLFHPTISQMMFTAFNCISVDQNNYLKQDVNSICYSGSHLKIILSVVLPSLALWTFGIPLVGFILLFKNRKLIKKMNSHEDVSPQEKQNIMKLNFKYGFLFGGYAQKYYYWEIMVVYRKIAIIMVTVYFSTVSQSIQIWASLLVILICSFLQIVNSPHRTPILNKMESLSLLVQTSTLYTGLFYITEEFDIFINSEWLTILFYIVLLVPNILFFGYWGVYFVFELIKEVHKLSKRLFNCLVCGLISYEKFYQKYMSPKSHVDGEYKEDEVQIVARTLSVQERASIGLERSPMSESYLVQNSSNRQLLNEEPNPKQSKVKPRKVRKRRFKEDLQVKDTQGETEAKVKRKKSPDPNVRPVMKQNKKDDLEFEDKVYQF